MRKIIHWVHTSLDGYIAGPRGEFDWPVFSPEMADYSYALNDRVDTFLYGRVVWDVMSSYWPRAEELSDHPHDLKFAPVWRETPKVVFSRTLAEAGWNTRVASGDLHAEVTALKERPGKDLLLSGGASLAGALTDLGLIDEYHIAVNPVVLGGGKPLFARRDTRVGLELTGSRAVEGGAVILAYRPAKTEG